MKNTRILICGFIVSSCLPVQTTDAEDAFEYWAGFPPPKEFKILEGEYYKSPHFTHEFEVYLKMIPTDEWWSNLVDQYKLSEDYGTWTKPEKAPEWFNPSSKLTMYSRHEEYDQSRFFRDSISGEYLYMKFNIEFSNLQIDTSTNSQINIPILSTYYHFAALQQKVWC